MKNKPRPSSLTRRGFLRSSSLAATALSYNRVAARAAGIEASDLLRVALVGCGSQGSMVLLPSLSRIRGVKVTAVCDIRESAMLISQRSISQRSGGTVQGFLNYDAMLEKAGRDFDAVFIATPCWMHAPQTRKALEAGKHVYCEKMISNALEPARDMVRAQRQTGRLLQIGNQRRSHPRYLHLRDRIIRDHHLPGRITHLYGQWHRGVTQPLLPRISPNEEQAVLAAGYASVLEYANWRWFKKYGGGPLADLGSHQIDVFNMLLGVPPRSVIASGGTDYYREFEYQPGRKLTCEHLDNAMVVYEYDVPGHGLVRAHYQILTTSSYENHHEKVYGTEATAVISEQFSGGHVHPEIYRERNTTFTTDPGAPGGVYPAAGSPVAKGEVDKRAAWEKALKDGTLASPTRPGNPGGGSGTPETACVYDFPPLSKEDDAKLPHQFHVENFLDTIRRAGKQTDLACPVEEAFKTCVAVLAVNDAVRDGKRIELKPQEYVVS